MTTSNLLIGFLIIFLLYQLAEANGQDLLKFPGKPYSILLLFLLILPAAALIARWQNNSGLAAYGMGLYAGWWQNYLLGVGLGLVVQTILEYVGIQLGVRHVSNFHFSWRILIAGILWVLFTNFPAAAGEDLITRGYLWRFMQTSPLLVFVLISSLVYTLNHIIRLLTRPVTNWYHLPFLGVTLAYALYQTGSLWFVIGLHQSGNVIYYLMQQMVDITNTTNIKKRIIFGIFSELIVLIVVALVIPLVNKVIP
jgi:membrane protease YdiL (CAAX protease family)